MQCGQLQVYCSRRLSALYRRDTSQKPCYKMVHQRFQGITEFNGDILFGMSADTYATLYVWASHDVTMLPEEWGHTSLLGVKAAQKFKSGLTV